MGGPLPGVTGATAGVIIAGVVARVLGVSIPAGFSLLAGITGVSSGDDSEYEKARTAAAPEAFPKE